MSLIIFGDAPIVEIQGTDTYLKNNLADSYTDDFFVIYLFRFGCIVQAFCARNPTKSSLSTNN